MKMILAAGAVMSLALLTGCTITIGTPKLSESGQATSETSASSSATTRTVYATNFAHPDDEAGSTSPKPDTPGNAKETQANTISYQRFDLGADAGLDIPSGTHVTGDSIAGYCFEWGNLSGNASTGGDEGGTAGFTYDEAVHLFARQDE